MTLVESKDTLIQVTAPKLSTGWKWTAKSRVQQAQSALQFGDIVGQVQFGRGGFGLSGRQPWWSQVAPKEWKQESNKCAKAVSHFDTSSLGAKSASLSRKIHLETQSSAQSSGSRPGEQENLHQYLATQKNHLEPAHCLCPGGNKHQPRARSGELKAARDWQMLV